MEDHGGSVFLLAEAMEGFLDQILNLHFCGSPAKFVNF